MASILLTLLKDFLRSALNHSKSFPYFVSFGSL
jgi:hypothetical protein